MSKKADKTRSRQLGVRNDLFMTNIEQQTSGCVVVLAFVQSRRRLFDIQADEIASVDFPKLLSPRFLTLKLVR